MARNSRYSRRRRQNQKKAFAIIVVIVVVICVLAFLGGKKLAQKPELSLNGSDTVTIQAGDTFTDPGATAVLGKKNITSQIKVDSDLDPEKAGTYTVTYTVSRFKTDYSVSRSVVVADTVAPEIALVGEKRMEIEQGDTFTDPGATATDNVDGDITSQIKVKGSVDAEIAGDYILKYVVKDSSGNKAAVKRKVTVKYKEGEGSAVIYLTFDDGPSSEVTPKNLDILKKNDVKATFFICNYSEENKKILQRELDEGHTIGIHGYSHEYGDIYKSTDAFMDNINKLRDKLKKDTGYEAFCLRFPGGSSNTISRKYSEGIMTELTKLVEKEGWSYYDWNVSSGDAESNSVATETIVKNVTEGFTKKHPNMVLMHDTNAKTSTTDALQQIIDYGKENGYVFRAIDKNTAPVHQGVNN